MSFYIQQFIAKYFCYGLRKQGTEEGSWNGALVWTPFVVGLFEDGRDYIAYIPSEASYSYVKKEVWDKKVEEGWLPMTRKDIKLTAGL